MKRAASAKLHGYTAFAAAAILAGLAIGLPELVVIGAPFALVVAVGLVTATAPVLEGEVELGEPRTVEGEEVDVVVRVRTPTGAPRVELLVALPVDLAVVDGDNPVAFRLGRGEKREFALRLRCDRWGAYLIGDLRVRLRDRLGLFSWESGIDRRTPLKVYPRPEVLRNAPRARETQVYAGNQVSRQKGDGIEFADLRPFAAGDLVRRVNWRASARRSELWVNEFHPERNADVILFLDVFAEARAGGSGTLDRAVRAAAAIADHYLREKDRVGFVSFGGILNWLLPTTGVQQLYRIVDAVLDSRIVLNYAWKDIDVIPRRTLPPKALVLALTPLVDPRAAAALLDLRARGFDLAVVEVSPLAHVPPTTDASDALATRLWPLRRQALRTTYARAGVPIAVWDDKTPLDGALEEVGRYRRYASRR